MNIYCKFSEIGLFCLHLYYEALTFLGPTGVIVTQELNYILNIPLWSHWSRQFSARVAEGFKISDL